MDPQIDKAAPSCAERVFSTKAADPSCEKALELIEDLAVCRSSVMKECAKRELKNTIVEIQKLYSETTSALQHEIMRQKTSAEPKPLVSYDAIVFKVSYDEGGRAIKHIDAEYLMHHDANEDFKEDRTRVIFPIRGYDSQKRVIFDVVQNNSAVFEMLGCLCHPMRMARAVDSDMPEDTPLSSDSSEPLLYPDRLDQQLTPNELNCYLGNDVSLSGLEATQLSTLFETLPLSADSTESLSSDVSNENGESKDESTPS